MILIYNVLYYRATKIRISENKNKFYLIFITQEYLRAFAERSKNECLFVAPRTQIRFALNLISPLLLQRYEKKFIRANFSYRFGTKFNTN